MQMSLPVWNKSPQKEISPYHLFGGTGICLFEIFRCIVALKCEFIGKYYCLFSQNGV